MVMGRIRVHMHIYKYIYIFVTNLGSLCSFCSYPYLSRDKLALVRRNSSFYSQLLERLNIGDYEYLFHFHVKETQEESDQSNNDQVGGCCPLRGRVKTNSSLSCWWGTCFLMTPGLVTEEALASCSALWPWLESKARESHRALCTFLAVTVHTEGWWIA
jgi:hypothetical protein